jgi:hypothetical protein
VSPAGDRAVGQPETNASRRRTPAGDERQPETNASRETLAVEVGGPANRAGGWHVVKGVQVRGTDNQTP